MKKTNQKLIPLTSNTMFKELFGREENKNVLAYLLCIYFDLDYKFVYDNIKHLNTQLGIEHIKNYKYNVDVIVSLNNKVVIGLEMNKSFWKGLENRNLSYISNTFSSQFRSGSLKEDFYNSKKHIQINFNNYNYPKDKERGIYRLKEIETNEELTDIIEIHHINLEMIKSKCYNEVEELSNIDKVGNFLKSEDIDEVSKIVGEEMKDILDKLIELSNDEKLVGLYNEEELQEQIKKSIREDAIEQGIEQEKLNIAKKMLEENIDVNIISKVTELSIKQIKNIIKK